MTVRELRETLGRLPGEMEIGVVIPPSDLIYNVGIATVREVSVTRAGTRYAYHLAVPEPGQRLMLLMCAHGLCYVEGPES